MREFFEEKKRRKWPVESIPKELGRDIEKILAEEYSDVNVRIRTLLQNAWTKKNKKRKAATGKLPGWLSILFCNEGQPSTTKPLPIPFDTQNGKLVFEDRYLLKLRLERLPSDTLQKSPSFEDTCVILMKDNWGAKAILDRILEGTYKFKGSSIQFKKRKWYVLISYEAPQKVLNLNQERVLHVWPAATRGWLCKVDGQKHLIKLGSKGTHVQRMREVIQLSRRQRQEHYRWGGSNQKGRGRKRAILSWQRRESKWMEFCKKYLEEIRNQVVQIATDRNCGFIVYHQPVEDRRDRCFLSRAKCDRKIKKDDKRTLHFNYYSFGTLLANKCNQHNIKLEVIKREVPQLVEAE